MRGLDLEIVADMGTFFPKILPNLMLRNTLNNMRLLTQRQIAKCTWGINGACGGNIEKTAVTVSVYFILEISYLKYLLYLVKLRLKTIILGFSNEINYGYVKLLQIHNQPIIEARY